MNAIPTRALGKTGVKVSILGVGGHHLGDPESYGDCERIVHEAIDAGVTFFDNCWEYHNGKSEDWAGRAIASSGKRKDLFLMTKVCTHGRPGSATMALQMLDESLRRLRTDYLDLWQIHGVAFDNDPDLAVGQGGVVEALDQAKRAGKVRFTGFTGHKDPGIHLRMLQTGYPFDTVQMPLNCYDATWRSFEQRVLPEANRRGVAVLGMKPLTGRARPIQKGDVTAAEMLLYAMSLPVATTLCGMNTVEHLRQNLDVVRSFKPMTPEEMNTLRERCRAKAADGRYELYKVSLAFDNPQARLAHAFPLDEASKEVKEALGSMTSLSPPRP
jgi:aryl-alcohol dehydrogenase-like predicted oxidoreductase